MYIKQNRTNAWRLKRREWTTPGTQTNRPIRQPHDVHVCQCIYTVAKHPLVSVGLKSRTVPYIPIKLIIC